MGISMDEVYQSGLDDAWEAARRIVSVDTRTGGIPCDDLALMFDGFRGSHDILNNFSAAEAIDKIKEYDVARIPETAEIGVGDTVMVKDRPGCWIVTHVQHDKFSEIRKVIGYYLINQDTGIFVYKKDIQKKCDFSFKQLESLLNTMNRMV